jgi:dGTP triphosphohydrolase
MFKRNSKSNQAGFTFYVDEGQDIKFQIGDQSYYLMDILEELSNKINKVGLYLFLGITVTIIILVSYTIPVALSNLSYQTIKEQTSIIKEQSVKIKELETLVFKETKDLNIKNAELKDELNIKNAELKDALNIKNAELKDALNNEARQLLKEIASAKVEFMYLKGQLGK